MKNLVRSFKKYLSFKKSVKVFVIFIFAFISLQLKTKVAHSDVQILQVLKSKCTNVLSRVGFYNADPLDLLNDYSESKFQFVLTGLSDYGINKK